MVAAFGHGDRVVAAFDHDDVFDGLLGGIGFFSLEGFVDGGF